MSALAGLLRRIRARAWLQRQARTTASGHTACALARTRSARLTCRPPRYEDYLKQEDIR